MNAWATFWLNLPPLIAATSAAIIALRTKKKVDSLHEDVNGRLSELVVSTDRAARAEGEAKGRAERRGDGAV